MSNRKNDWNHKNIWNHGYVTTPQAHLYYEISGHGTPILFLHGNSQSHHIFHSYKRNLQKNYQVILMDSRGHGFSHLKDSWANRLFTIHDMALDVAALLDKLHISKIILFGFSDGANIALEFSRLYPERTLAVISASGNAWLASSRPPGSQIYRTDFQNNKEIGPRRTTSSISYKLATVKLPADRLPIPLR